MKNLLSLVYKHEERTNNTHIEPCSVEKENLFVPSVWQSWRHVYNGLIWSDVFGGFVKSKRDHPPTCLKVRSRPEIARKEGTIRGLCAEPGVPACSSNVDEVNECTFVVASLEI